jgi:hypothetical protein
MALWKRRAGLSTAVAMLPPVAQEYTAHSVMTEARRNVRARMIQRLSNINGIRTRMSNGVIRNLQSMSQNQNPSRGNSPSRKGPSQ